MANKQKLKTVFLRKRQALTEEEYDKRNAQLFYHLSELIFVHDVQTIHTFLPIKKNKEVDTYIVLKYLQALEKKVVISKVEEDTNALKHFIFENKDQLEENKWGIPEPITGQAIRSNEIEMVLIPLIAFDKKGHRIGYGKGYYDRFLSECKPSCIKIGLSLTTGLDEIPYTEAHDVPMTYCVTPSGVLKFQ